MFYKKGSADGIYYSGERNLEAFEEFLFSEYQKEDDSASEAAAQQEETPSQANEAVYALDGSNFKDFTANGFHFIKFCKFIFLTRAYRTMLSS